MRLTRLSAFSFALAALALTACGDDGGSTRPDAKIFLDAPIDGPAALTGLGQRCSASADCPASAPSCLTGGAFGYCTKACVNQASLMTDAQSMIVEASVTPPFAQWDDSICEAVYTGTAGSGSCEVIANLTPAPPLAPNTTYSFLVACGIACGANNECPTGFTCDTQFGSCEPG